MEKLNNQWGQEEWKEMRDKLEKLSLDEILLIANNAGVRFEGGNENIFDTNKMTAKEQFILVLDEVPKAILVKEYLKISKNK